MDRDVDVKAEVEVWQVDVEQPPLPRQQLWGWLTEEERARAERFHFEADQQRFVVGRGVLRARLGAALATEPDAVALAASPEGKPCLAGDTAPALRFNVSHSGRVALIALAWSREVGVDVEQVRDNLELERIAERFFSPAEVVALRACAPSDQTEAFFRCWTRKEAYIKAHGAGLSYGLDSFSVPLTEAESGEHLHIITRPDSASRWSLYHIAPGAGYVGALAVEGTGARVSHRVWTA